jgi:5-methylcytosine-specific restriction endonuclease McrA
MQLQVPRWVHEHMREAMDLLGEQMRDRDYVELIGRAFVVYLAHLQQRRYGATRRPRAPRGSRSSDPRRIPAEIKREVWSRDEGRCTFVGPMGNRCACRRGLEFDHIVPVARGGPATTENLRLRCRVHNQYEAERVFGTEFMRRKREAARSDR